MFDKALTPLAHKLVRPAVIIADKYGVRPDQITIIGFLIGMMALPLLAMQWYGAALFVIMLNRVFDGIDGELARHQQTQSDAGGYIDICLDFIFYAAVPFGFILADSHANGLAGAALIFAFMGTGSSFLAFAIFSEKNNIPRIQFDRKSFQYINGLAEGSETIAFFIIVCLFPEYFTILAWIFVVICVITAITRIYGGYRTLRVFNERYRD